MRKSLVPAVIVVLSGAAGAATARAASPDPVSAFEEWAAAQGTPVEHAACSVEEGVVTCYGLLAADPTSDWAWSEVLVGTAVDESLEFVQVQWFPAGPTIPVAPTPSVSPSAPVASGDVPDSDVSEEEQPYVDAFVESAANVDEGDLQISPAEAECFGARFVDVVGIDRLEEAGITPEDLAADTDFDFSAIGLTEQEGGEIYDAFGSCDVEIREEFLQSLNADNSISEEDQECLAEAFDEDLLRRIFVTTFVEGEDALDQDEELMGEVFAVFAQCPGAAPD